MNVQLVARLEVGLQDKKSGGEKGVVNGDIYYISDCSSTKIICLGNTEMIQRSIYNQCYYI